MNLLDVLLCQTTFLLLLLSMHLTYNVDYTVTSIIIILSLYYYSLISLLYWLTRWNKKSDFSLKKKIIKIILLIVVW